MFGDIKYVVDNYTHLNGKLHNNQTELFFNWVWEAIVYNMVEFYHVPGGDNPDNILSNH